MKLVDKIVEQRDRQVTARAQPHLDDGEEIVHWARMRHVGGRREGFVYVTEERLIVHWQGRRDNQVLAWNGVESWGVDPSAPPGPLLGVEVEDCHVLIQLPTRTRAAAAKAASLLEEVRRRVPEQASTYGSARNDSGRFTRHEVPIEAEKRSLAGKTRRGIVTLVGVALVLFGVFFGWLPVLPGFIPILAGLALLASEYDWAKDLSDWVKEKAKMARSRIKARKQPSG